MRAGGLIRVGVRDVTAGHTGARLPSAFAKGPHEMRKLPARYAPLVAPMLLSLLMTFVVSGIATWRGIGLPANFVSVWWGA